MCTSVPTLDLIVLMRTCSGSPCQKLQRNPALFRLRTTPVTPSEVGALVSGPHLPPKASLKAITDTQTIRRCHIHTSTLSTSKTRAQICQKNKPTPRQALPNPSILELGAPGLREGWEQSQNKDGGASFPTEGFPGQREAPARPTPAP